jgi:hypothetical protein
MLEHLAAVSYVAFGLWGLIFVVWPLIVVFRERGRPRPRPVEQPHDESLLPLHSH